MADNCHKTKIIIDIWERDGTVSSSDYRLLIEHVERCSACSMRFGALIPLMGREVPEAETAGFPRLDEVYPEHPSAGFTDRVMARIREEGYRTPRQTKSSKGGFFTYAAVAAGLLIIGGLVLRFAILPFFKPAPEPVMAESAAESGVVEVRFTLAAPEAESVALVGDFTDWQTSKLQLRDTDGDGVWEVEIGLTKGRVYEYNYIIDGKKWIPDPDALVQVDDGFGGESSLLTL